MAWRKDGEIVSHVRRTERRLHPGIAIRINPVIIKDVWSGPNLPIVDGDSNQFRAIPLHLLQPTFHHFNWMHPAARKELFEFK